MQYYIRSKKELHFILSAPFDTRESAEAELNKADDKTKKKSNIFEVPVIKDGLNLYRSRKYWKTIIGKSTNLWFLNDVDNLDDISTPVNKETLVNWFINGSLDADKEDYNCNIKFEDLDYVSDISDEDVHIETNAEDDESED